MGGDPAPQSAGESTAQALQGLVANLPALIKTYTENILPVEQATQNAQNVIAPQNQQLQADLYSKYAPQLNKVGQDIYSSNVTNTAQADLNALSGPGKALNQEVLAQQMATDPEFFANRKAASEAFQKLIGGMDPNALSGSELAQEERGINRLNGANGFNPQAQTTTLAAAGSFGDALSKKRADLTNALNTFQGLQTGAKSGIDVAQVATGKPSNNNYAANQLTGSLQGNLGGQTANLTNNLLGVSAANVTNQQNLASQQRDSLDRVAQIMGSVSC